MARRGQPFEQRYYFKEPAQSNSATLQPTLSKVSCGDSSKAVGMQVGKNQ